MKKITTLQRISNIVRGIHTQILRWKGMDIAPHSIVARTAHMDRPNPRGIHIGEYSHIAVYASVLSHDPFRGKGNVDTYIGHHTVIAGHAIVLPGLTIGNHCFIAAGAIVTKDVPDHCLVAGNPARIVKEGIRINNSYQIVDFGHRIEK